MENQLRQFYLLVCHIYDAYSATCFQRLSNNTESAFTDQEMMFVAQRIHRSRIFNFNCCV